MGNAPLKLLGVLAFLSALFITFSLAGALPADKVPVCVYRASMASDSVAFESFACNRTYELNTIQREYRCGFVPSSCAGDGYIRARIPGEDAVLYPSRLEVLHKGRDISVSRLAYVSNGDEYVVFSGYGAGYVRVDENVPKDVARSHEQVIGDVVFLNLDPVIRVFLRVENGKFDAVRYILRDVNTLTHTDHEIAFASCSVSIDVQGVCVVKAGDGDYVTGTFTIYDSGTPIVARDVFVSVGNNVVTPQISTASMEYTFMVPYGGEKTVGISVRVPGCASISKVVTVEKGSNMLTVLVLLLVAAAFATAAYIYVRRR